MLNVLKRPEIYISAFISSDCHAHRESLVIYPCTLYDTMYMNINIVNNKGIFCGDKTIDTAVKLTLSIFAVQTNGTDYSQVDSILLHGSYQIALPLIEPHDTYSHRNSFICLSQGRFGLMYEVKEAFHSPAEQKSFDYFNQSLKKIIYIIAEW